MLQEDSSQKGGQLGPLGPKIMTSWKFKRVRTSHALMPWGILTSALWGWVQYDSVESQLTAVCFINKRAQLILKRRGPRMNPWAIPQRVANDEWHLPWEMERLLSDSFDLSHSKAVALTCCSRWEIKTLWSNASQAAVKCKSISMTVPKANG